MTYILRLTDARATDSAFSGGKGANLARLTQAGFSVPRGFVISPSAYRDAFGLIAAGFPLGTIDHANQSAIQRASGEVVSALRRVAVPPELVAEIASHCAEFDAGTTWAVRSSGTAEDLAGAAFAGQHDTFLNCAFVDDIVLRVVDCWCSLWAPRAIAYRARMGFAHDEVAMAVVVQQMVQAEVAGVAFTTDPVTGNLDHVVIDANFGLGESVVSGEAQVDHLVVDRRSWHVTAAHVASKRMRVVAAESGTITVEVSATEAQRPALAEPDAVAVARLAARVEEHFGWPQDIEWALANGCLTLLQSRPITTLPPRWTRDESAERFPNVVTPLTWDFVEEGFHRSLNHSFALMGLPAYDGKWFARFGNYVYGNQNAVELYARRSPVPALTLPELVAHLPAIIQRFRWIRTLPGEWRRALPTFLAEMDAFRAERVEEYDLPNLWNYLERVNAEGTRYFLPNIAISIGHGVLHRAVRALVELARPRADTEVVCAALVAGETMTTRVNAELRALATIAREDGTAERLSVRRSAELWLEESACDAPFWNTMREFISAHGHRETDFDAYHPTWAEAPWVVLDHVRALAATTGVEGRPDASSLSQAEAERMVLHALPAQLLPIAARVIALAREYIALDDLEHYHTTRLSLPLRRGVRQIGRRLLSLGIVDDEMDAFFASAATLRDAIADPRHMESLRVEIASNKAAYLAAKATTPPWSLDAQAPEAAAPNDGAALAGIAGSPGVAEGVVHIVRDAADFAGFPRGAVLVARTTNPAWTPLFYSASAVVTESGGPLSHGAVTAREMRIPAVMSVRGVLGRLHNGDRVRVDGAAGRVEVVSAA